jgi:cytidylate kinase
MKIDLIKYMSDRLQEEQGKSHEAGPVITISRLSACPAKSVAKLLAEEITRKNIANGIKSAEWRHVTKEIMSESARELEMDPKQIRYIFDCEEKSIIDGILLASTIKYYKSDQKIRNTIAKVIRNIATEGNVIIVGRGGIAITRDISRSLHINLEAPLEWRVMRNAERENLNYSDAEKLTLEVDKKRKQFREYFEGKNTDYTWFDMTFNCMTLSVDEIVKIIIKAAEVRKLI